MGRALEEAKMNDPRTLRARIAELERAAQMVRPPAPAKPGKVVHVPIFRETDLRRIETIASRLSGGSNALEVAADKLCQVAEDLAAGRAAMQKSLQELVDVGRRALAPQVEITQVTTTRPAITFPKTAPAATVAPKASRAPAAAPRPRPATPAPAGGYAVTKGARVALTALAQHPDGLTRRKLGILTGYAPGGTSMREILALCRKVDEEGTKAAWVDDLTDGTIRITAAGRTVLGEYEPLPATPAHRREHWFRELPTSASRLLRALCDKHPQGLDKDGLAAATAADGLGTSYAAGGTSMREALACLRGMELVDDRDGQIFASRDLF